MIYLFRYTFTSKIPIWTETFIYYELHKLGVRGPSWGTLPHKCIFFFPVFLFSLSSVVTLATLATAIALTRSEMFY